VYVQIPASAHLTGTLDLIGQMLGQASPKKQSAFPSLTPLLQLGVVLLLVALPVGVVFGLLSTWRLICSRDVTSPTPTSFPPCGRLGLPPDNRPDQRVRAGRSGRARMKIWW
jgi:hypothetical protein